MEAVESALGLNGSASPPALHPYYPLEVEIIGYLANEWSVVTLLSIFTAGIVALLGVTRVVAKKIQPSIADTELLCVMWFVLTASIHLFFEGYYAYNYRAMGQLQTLFGQLWKEYALSDSRYLTQDPFVLCMESITAFTWGPLSFVTAYFIMIQHPMRHPLQLIISLGQIYGLVLYYGTSMFDHYFYNIDYSRPEAYYFWGYYFLMNFFWIVFPGILMYNSCRAISKAMSHFQKSNDPTPRANLRSGKKLL